MFGKLWVWEDTEITGITDNSQRISSGHIFICQKGEKNDGADYIDEAVKRGAAVVIADRMLESTVPVIKIKEHELLEKFYLPKGRNFKLIGVTGTNGKTTVTHIIKDMLFAMGRRVGLIGTNGVFLDNEQLELFSSTPTTPKLCELYNIFSRLSELGAEYIVMEVSSHALELNRVSGCEFDVGVFTNLSHDHLDFHKSMENYKKAKAKLFAVSRVSVINIDDTAGAEIYSNISAEKISAGLNYADISASAVSMNSWGSKFILEYQGKTAPTEIALSGKFNIYNAILAAGACLGLGFGLTETAEALSRAKPVRGRMERFKTDADFDIIIDYAHSPDGLEKVIHTVKGFARGRVITVFGCGGDRDREKRPIMGEIAGRYSDFTIITSDNPRCENEMAIISDIYEGIRKMQGEFIIIPERESAIEYAVRIAKERDIIILAGKGAEDYQIIGQEKRHFDERKIAEECIKRKRRGQCRNSV